MTSLSITPRPWSAPREAQVLRWARLTPTSASLGMALVLAATVGNAQQVTLKDLRKGLKSNDTICSEHRPLCVRNLLDLRDKARSLTSEDQAEFLEDLAKEFSKLNEPGTAHAVEVDAANLRIDAALAEGARVKAIKLARKLLDKLDHHTRFDAAHAKDVLFRLQNGKHGTLSTKEAEEVADLIAGFKRLDLPPLPAPTATATPIPPPAPTPTPRPVFYSRSLWPSDPPGKPPTLDEGDRQMLDQARRLPGSVGNAIARTAALWVVDEYGLEFLERRAGALLDLWAKADDLTAFLIRTLAVGSDQLDLAAVAAARQQTEATAAQVAALRADIARSMALSRNRFKVNAAIAAGCSSIDTLTQAKGGSANADLPSSSPPAGPAPETKPRALVPVTWPSAPFPALAELGLAVGDDLDREVTAAMALDLALEGSTRGQLEKESKRRWSQARALFHVLLLQEMLGDSGAGLHPTWTSLTTQQQVLTAHLTWLRDTVRGQSHRLGDSRRIEQELTSALTWLEGRPSDEIRRLVDWRHAAAGHTEGTVAALDRHRLSLELSLDLSLDTWCQLHRMAELERLLEQR